MSFSRLHHPIHHPFFRGLDWWDRDWNTPERLFDQHFGVAPYWRRQFSISSPTTAEAAPVVEAAREELEKSGLSEVKNEKDKFIINLDVSHFSPEEINVKTKDNNLIISASHEEKMDQHGFVSRSFSRRYILPKDVDPEHFTSNLSPEGILTIEAPKKVIDKPSERTIPIGTSQRPAVRH